MSKRGRVWQNKCGRLPQAEVAPGTLPGTHLILSAPSLAMSALDEDISIRSVAVYWRLVVIGDGSAHLQAMRFLFLYDDAQYGSGVHCDPTMLRGNVHRAAEVLHGRSERQATQEAAARVE